MRTPHFRKCQNRVTSQIRAVHLNTAATEALWEFRPGCGQMSRSPYKHRAPSPFSRQHLAESSARDADSVFLLRGHFRRRTRAVPEEGPSRRLRSARPPAPPAGPRRPPPPGHSSSQRLSRERMEAPGTLLAPSRGERDWGWCYLEAPLRRSAPSRCRRAVPRSRRGATASLRHGRSAPSRPQRSLPPSSRRGSAPRRGGGAAEPGRPRVPGPVGERLPVPPPFGPAGKLQLVEQLRMRAWALDAWSIFVGFCLLVYLFL